MPRGVLHPKMIANQWKPGQSGNPKGKPPRPSFESIVRKVLDETVGSTGQTKREVVARVFVDEMIRRNSPLIKELLAREWPVKSMLEISGGENPVEIQTAPKEDELGECAGLVVELEQSNG
jgi:hypothetical protein